MSKFIDDVLAYTSIVGVTVGIHAYKQGWETSIFPTIVFVDKNLDTLKTFVHDKSRIVELHDKYFILEEDSIRIKVAIVAHSEYIHTYLQKGFLNCDTVGINIRNGYATEYFSLIATDTIIDIKNPSRMVEDPLLMVRTIIWATRNKLSISINLANTLKIYNFSLAYADPKEIGFILNDIVLGADPKKVLTALEQFNLLEHIFPRLSKSKVLLQEKKNGITLFEHSLYSLEAAKDFSPEVKWAALLHDLAKPETEKIIKGKTRYFKHEIIGAKKAFADLTRWGFPTKFAKEVAILVRDHMFDANPQLTPNGVRSLIKRTGESRIFNLLNLRLADSAGTINPPNNKWKIDLLKDKIAKELSKNPFSINGLALTLEDIKRIAKIDDATAKKIQILLLDLVLFYELDNKVSSLESWLSSINFETLHKFCPMGIAWVLEQQINRIENKADENEDGSLKCGSRCGYLCDTKGNELWRY